MDHSSRPDQELLLIFKSGDVQGFNALFYRHWASLYQISTKILQDEDLAKDTVQETFVSLYENAKHKDITHVKAYLLQSVKYQCFMHLRSGRISQKHLNRLQTVSNASYVEEYMDAAEMQNLLRQKIETLPEKCREVFCLSRFELLSNKKIAERLNISQKTVEHQITKALKTLRVSIGKLVALAIFMLS